MFRAKLIDEGYEYGIAVLRQVGVHGGHDADTLEDDIEAKGEK